MTGDNNIVLRGNKRRGVEIARPCDIRDNGDKSGRLMIVR